MPIEATLVDGDLLEQDVDVIVNAWNRNIIPWWLLLPQGVSGAIKKRGGLAPFREVGRQGPLPLGQAVATGAGRLPYRAIIHVAGINMLWRASERSVRDSVRNALHVARDLEPPSVASLAFPLIGAGSGGKATERVLSWMQAELAELGSEDFAGEVRIVRYRPSGG